jgi:ribonuclease HI
LQLWSFTHYLNDEQIYSYLKGKKQMFPIAADFTKPLTSLADDFKPIGLVIYCDGGYRSNGHGEAGGWGVHGYYYDDEIRKAGYGLKNCEPTNFGYMGPAIALADPKGKALRMSYTNKLEEAHGVRILRYVDAYGNVLSDATNNVAELRALLHALQLTYESPDTLKHVHFVLDSKYVLEGCVKYRATWSKKGWCKSDGTIVQNVEYWKAIDALIQQVEYIGITIGWDWVKGHSDDIGNKAADELATFGVIAGYKDIELAELTISDVAKYWTPVADVPEVAREPRFYIRLGGEDTKLDGYVYHFGNQGGKDEVLGSPSADKMYCVIRSNEPFPVHEDLRTLQRLNNNGLARLSEVRNDTLCKPKVYNDILDNGALHLIADLKTSDIILPSEEIVAEVQWPAGQSNAVDQRLVWLENLLEAYLTGEMDNSPIFGLTDITNIVYTASEDKKGKRVLKLNKEVKINPSVIARSKSGDRVVNPTLIYGRDLPRHQVLSRVTEQNPRVVVLTWPDSLVSARFATLLQTDKADGIWCAVYANFVFTLNLTPDDTK